MTIRSSNTERDNLMMTRTLAVLLFLAILGAGCSRDQKTPTGDADKKDTSGTTKGTSSGTDKKAMTPDEQYAALKRLAESGNGEAQYEMGNWHSKGGPKPDLIDLPRAVEWWKKAAAQNHAKAQFMLGHAYKNGDGVPQNVNEAKAWYEKSAQKGELMAQHSLGLLLHPTSKRSVQNHAESFKWFQKAAAGGHADAQFMLGIEYEFGVIVPKDDAKAKEWYGKAAAQGHEQAKQKVGAGGTSGAGLKTQKETYANLVVEAKKEAEKKNQVVLLPPTLPDGGGTMTLLSDGSKHIIMEINPFSLSKAFWSERLKAEGFAQAKNVRVGSAVYSSFHRWTIRCSDNDLVFYGNYYNDKDGERYVTKVLEYKMK